MDRNVFIFFRRVDCEDSDIDVFRISSRMNLKMIWFICRGRMFLKKEKNDFVFGGLDRKV